MISQENKERIRKLFSNAMPRRKIAEFMGVDRSTVLVLTKDMQIPTRPCTICKGDFRPLQTNIKYCSRECVVKGAIFRREQKKVRLTTRNCVRCKKSFQPRQRSHAFCSLRCSKSYNNRRHYLRRKDKNG